MIGPEYEIVGDWKRDSDAVVSVCIANFNGSDVISACIQSVLDQETDVPIEVIVHDDASTDDSLQIVIEKFPSVKVIKSAENVGFCISNNRMAENSSAQYLLLLNNDAVLRPGAISAFYKRVQKLGPSEILGLPQISIEDGTPIDRGYEFDIFMNPVPRLDEGINDVAAATGACLWIPRGIWDKVGGFPDWFESVAEDIYICQAARLLGYRITILSGPEFDHWVGGVLGGGKLIGGKLVSTAGRRILSERNKSAVMLICYPIPLLLLLMPVHFLFLWVEALFLLVTGASFTSIWKIYCRVPWSLARRARQIGAKRTSLQEKRGISRFAYVARFKLYPWKLVLLWRHGRPQIR